MIASLHGLCEAAQVLLEAGAVVNRAKRDGLTALHLAVFKGHKAVVRLLLVAGADVNLVSKVFLLFFL